MDKLKEKKLKASKNESVQVVVRCRPMSEKEKSTNNISVIEVWPSRGVIEVINPKENNISRENKKNFTYDAVYDWFANQDSIYDETVRPLVASVLEGFNGCVFAYGQTGTGKTYTMEGCRRGKEEYGMIPKAFEQIWNHINHTKDTNFLVTTSYMEIYMEEIRDLLRIHHKKLEIHDGDGQGVRVDNLHTIVCKNVDDMLRVMRTGNKNRTVGSTNMNEHSSRSHAIFQVSIEMCNENGTCVRVGKLNLVDLAGSERQSKTGAVDERLKEASKINRALSSLGNVIYALAENSPHIPYRDSKLTRLLQDSLGGNSKTIMIANIGPASSNYEETITTLRYANRAKSINNKPVKNEDPKDAKLREYQQEIARLRALLAQRRHTEGIQKPLPEKGVSQQDESESEDEASDSTSIPEQKVELEKTIELEKMKTEELTKKLKSLEKQLVRGGKNILDSMNEREIEIEKQLAEIAARRKREIEMQQLLELEEETTSELRETFTTLQQELEYKTNKLTKMHNRWLALKQEIKDIKDEHIRDRRELEAVQEDLIKQLKYKCIYLDNFIPPDVRGKLLVQVDFDENTDDWVYIRKLPEPSEMVRTRAKPYNRRTMTDFSVRKAKLPESTKYRYENVFDLEFDQPNTSKLHYIKPTVPPEYRAMIEGFYKEEINKNRIEVHEPPPSFQPRLFPRRELERRFEKASKSMIDLPLEQKIVPKKEYPKSATPRYSLHK